MQKYKRFACLFWLTCGMLLVAACVTPTAPAAAPAPGGLPERGTLRVPHAEALGGAESMDPYSRTRFLEAILMVYDKLVVVNEQGLPAPALATEWSSNDAATEWTFKLRTGVKFHDGSTFDAADVVYSIQRMVDPALESPVAATLGVLDTLETVDTTTVVMKLKSPYADFPLLLTDHRMGIIPDGSGDTIATTGIGTGPFVLQTLDGSGVSTLVANDTYWDGQPGAAQVEIYSIPDAEARIQAMLAGQLDWLGVPSDQLARFQDNPQIKIQSIPSGGWLGFVMRTDTAPFDDVRVRRALRIVADRAELLKLVLGESNGVVSCDQPVGPQDPYHAELECPQDIAGAQALLAEAGYADGITVDLHIAGIIGAWAPMAEIYQRQAAAAGITVNIVNEAADAYWTSVWMVEPFFATGWEERTADGALSEMLRTGSPWNESYWSNPKFDELLDQAHGTLDFDARKALYGQAQQLVWEEGGVFIPFYPSVGTYALSTQVQSFPAVGPFNIRWQQVQVSK